MDRKPVVAFSGQIYALGEPKQRLGIVRPLGTEERTHNVLTPTEIILPNKEELTELLELLCHAHSTHQLKPFTGQPCVTLVYSRGSMFPFAEL